jgi:hypothetical protein
MAMKKHVDWTCYTDTTLDAVYIGNRGHFIGRPIQPKGRSDYSRRSLYEDVLDGRNDWFVKHHGTDKAAAGMHMINLTKGLCKVSFRKETDGNDYLIGDCDDCRKKLGHDCPVLLRIRQEMKMGTLNNTSVDDRVKTLLQAGVRNGSQNIGGLSGMAGKKRKKTQVS